MDYLAPCSETKSAIKCHSFEKDCLVLNRSYASGYLELACEPDCQVLENCSGLSSHSTVTKVSQDLLKGPKASLRRKSACFLE